MELDIINFIVKNKLLVHHYFTLELYQNGIK